jgi:hypothetical protein
LNSITLTYAAVFALLVITAVLISGLGGSISHGLNRQTVKRKKAGGLKPSKHTPITKLRRINQNRRSLMHELRLSNTIYYLMTAAGTIGGFFIGKMFFSGMLFGFAVAILGALAPMLYMNFKQTGEKSAQIEKLLSSMMILSNSYIVTEDILKTVRDNIDVLEYPSPFRDFLTYVSLIDSNIKTGLRRMEIHVDNIYFLQWIDVLIMAQDDRSLKYVTMSVVEAMNDVHLAQRAADTDMFSIWREYFTVLILIFSAPVIFRILMRPAYVILVTTLPGRTLLLLLLIAVAWSLVRAVRLNKPLLM